MAKKKSEPISAPAAEPQKEESQSSVEIGQPVEKKNITATLFPETVVVESSGEEEAKETVQPEVEAQPEPKPEEQKKEEFVYLDDILKEKGLSPDKIKSKIKVDGKEEEIPYSEFVKRVQLKTHLDQAGQELGKQRREIMELRKKIEDEMSVSPIPARARQPEEEIPDQESRDPLVEKLIQRISDLEAQTAGLRPVIYDVNRQKVAKELKNEGFDDFLDYIPKMESYLANIKDRALAEYYDTEVGAKALYHQMKNRELMDELKSEREKKSQPVISESSTQEKKKPPIVKINSGSQSSSIQNVDDYWAKHNELLSRWKNNRNDKAAFHELLKMKNALTFTE